MKCFFSQTTSRTSTRTLADMKTVISVEGLRRSYGDVDAVRDVSFAVERGEIFGILGPNGAGKTTTVECLQGLRGRDGGDVEVLGIDPERHPDRLRGLVGSQLQLASLPDRLRVAEAVKFFARAQESRIDIEATLATWNLTALRKRAFATLSGGERQRLFLALALLGNPEVVFLDELTAALDPAARRATWQLVRRVRDAGATIILVTHFMEEAEELCDRLAIVDAGEVVAIGTPTELTTGTDAAATRVSFSLNGHDVRFLDSLAGVRSLSMDSRHVEVIGDSQIAVRVAAALAEREILPSDYRTHHPTLEDVFLAHTGRRLHKEDSS